MATTQQRRAYVVAVDWPFRQLTTLGKLTDVFTGFAETHLGIFIPNCTPHEVAAHSVPNVSDVTARNMRHVCFDYLADKYPRFQSTTNPSFWTDETRVWLYPILGVHATAVHSACEEVALLKPYNSTIYRLNPMLGGVWPFHCGSATSNGVAQSHCAALTMRIVARARSGNVRAYTDDTAALNDLGVPIGGLEHPCAPQVLTGFKPRGALEAMQTAGVLGNAVEGFERAISLCRATSTKTGTVYTLNGHIPSLSMLREV
tara:strand:- start:4204 stop:4980 length:777 start_codon:yes stop_codon:yes gene_type:complete